MIVAPDPALAPVMPPVIVPMVHAKLLAALAVNAIPGPDPLQVLAVAALVTAGFGLTVTVIVKAAPTHDPVVEVGVTRYSTLPAVALLGLVNTWLIVAPDALLAPVMPPVIVPIVHAKLLGALAVSAMPGPNPLQALAVAALVTAGIGLTVTVMVNADPAHDPTVEVGVTRY